MAAPFPAVNPGNYQSVPANAIPVYIASGGSSTAVTRYAGVYTNYSGTITTANTSQQVLAANATRKTWFFQNTSSAIMYLNFTSAAAVAGAGSIAVAAGGTYTDPPEFVTTEAVYVACATATSAFVCKEGN